MTNLWISSNLSKEEFLISKMNKRISPTKNSRNSSSTPLPKEETIKNLCVLLDKKMAREDRDSKYAPVKNILVLLGKGAILSAALLAPKSASILLPLVEKSSDYNEWKKYNTSYLRRTLERLENQKVVKIVKEGDMQVIRLSANGKRKILKYSLDSLEIEKPKHWDGKWRLVLYDVPNYSRDLADMMRSSLKTLGFYPIQKSVFIIPYPCKDQIEFLREYFFLGGSVQYMVVDQLENDEVYKNYFGL